VWTDTLINFSRVGEYKTISSGMSDPKGRWQAFKDYSLVLHSTFKNTQKLLKLNIEEDEVGVIEEAAFNLIRFRTIKDMPKMHYIMRSLPQYCRSKDGKKEIIKIADEVEPVLPVSECRDLTPDEIDEKWASKYKTSITYHIRKAKKLHEIKTEKETPLALLEAAYKKMTHDDMDLSAISLSDQAQAREYIVEIKEISIDMEKTLYRFHKEQKNLCKQ